VLSDGDNANSPDQVISLIQLGTSVSTDTRVHLINPKTSVELVGAQVSAR
jgi:hypothetical protein